MAQVKKQSMKKRTISLIVGLTVVTMTIGARADTDATGGGGKDQGKITLRLLPDDGEVGSPPQVRLCSER